MAAALRTKSEKVTSSKETPGWTLPALGAEASRTQASVAQVPMVSFGTGFPAGLGFAAGLGFGLGVDADGFFFRCLCLDIKGALWIARQSTRLAFCLRFAG